MTHLTRRKPFPDIETVWKIHKINIEVIRFIFKLFYSYFKIHKIHKKLFDSHFMNIFVYRNLIFTKNNETLSINKLQPKYKIQKSDFSSFIF